MRIPSISLLALLAACHSADRASAEGVTLPSAPVLNVTPATWQVEVLALPSGHDRGVAYAIANNNRIAGYAETPAGIRTAVKWDNGAPVLAPVPGSIQSVAHDINVSGVMVGYAVGATTRWPVRWIGNQTQSLATGGVRGEARSVNDGNVAVGFLTQPSGAPSPARWAADGTLSNLQLPAGFSGGEAHSINNSGDIVGFVIAPNGDRRAFEWIRASGGKFLGPVWTTAIANNVSGTATGEYRSPQVAVRYGATGMTSFGADSYATAISDRERIALSIKLLPYTWRSGVLVELPSIASADLGRPYGVNACGTHVGLFMFPSKLVPARWYRGVCD
jgi:hypothetical protein